jgi:hypothetical protein
MRYFLRCISPLSSSLSSTAKCFLTVECAVALNAPLSFGKKAVQFSRFEITEGLELIERENGSFDDFFRTGVLPRIHALIDQLLYIGLQRNVHKDSIFSYCSRGRPPLSSLLAVVIVPDDDSLHGVSLGPNEQELPRSASQLPHRQNKYKERPVKTYGPLGRNWLN